jgi:hypothetical protein
MFAQQQPELAVVGQGEVRVECVLGLGVTIWPKLDQQLHRLVLGQSLNKGTSIKCHY